VDWVLRQRPLQAGYAGDFGERFRVWSYSGFPRQVSSIASKSFAGIFSCLAKDNLRNPIL
jgi:hypothetical protein